MDLLNSARFHTTVVRGAKLREANPQELPEIAFVGRSNAGKSTCLNLVCGRRRLAFSSRTPGRTQALNFFAVGPRDETIGFLVDTPGYGYAAAGQEAKRSWQSLAGQYMRRGAPVTGVVLLVDIRRELTPLDDELLGWIPEDLPLVVVLTKADKLASQARRAAWRRVSDDPRLTGRSGEVMTVAMSSLDRQGVPELIAAIESLVRHGSLFETERAESGAAESGAVRSVPAHDDLAETDPRIATRQAHGDGTQ